ncbi:MAG: hypothetical protein R3236_05425, partial [Phycisphaeraceae bacterium]|nr:hypothetical protein [Phycisphaeraceae bacterium]
GLLLLIAQAIGSGGNHTLRWIHIPTLEWVRRDGEPSVPLLLVEDRSELERLLQTFKGKFPDVVRADPR